MTRGRRVLVVEDEPTIAASVAARLRAEGFAVDVAHDGPSAVTQALEVPPDVVVLDVMLPGFDGLEVCRRLLRRVERAAQADPQRKVLGELSIDLAECRVTQGGEQVYLTPIEFDLLLHLAGQPRTMLARDALLAQVGGWSHAGGTRTVDSHVKALRRKLGSDLIRTVHGVGYALEVPR
jgi:DNA-binding response OmpR family regulator